MACSRAPSARRSSSIRWRRWASAIAQSVSHFARERALPCANSALPRQGPWLVLARNPSTLVGEGVLHAMDEKLEQSASDKDVHARRETFRKSAAAGPVDLGRVVWSDVRESLEGLVLTPLKKGAPTLSRPSNEAGTMTGLQTGGEDKAEREPIL